MNESFRVLGPSQAKSTFTALENALGSAVMDVIGGEHRDAGMTMLGVVPGEEGPAEGGRGGDVCEAPGCYSAWKIDPRVGEIGVQY